MGGCRKLVVVFSLFLGDSAWSLVWEFDVVDEAE